MAVEKLLELEVPRRAEWIRAIFNELQRLHSHLVLLGTGSLDLGAIAQLFYCFRERDRCSISSRWRAACACTTSYPRSAA